MPYTTNYSLKPNKKIYNYIQVFKSYRVFKSFFKAASKTGTIGFLIIDDTVNLKPQAKKIEGLDYHFSHTEGKSLWSHCVVTSNFTVRDISTPVDFCPYYLTTKKCEDINKHHNNFSVNLGQHFAYAVS